MTVPVLRAFSRHYPEVKITVISRPFFKPFFDEIPNVSFFDFDENVRHKGLRGLFRLFSDLKKLDVDAFADLHNVIRSKVITALFSLSGIKTATVDKARAQKKALTRADNKIFKPLKPVTQRHAEVFEKLGFRIDLSNSVFPKPRVMHSDVLTLTGTKTKSWIGIAPFAQYESKVYPIDLMQIVIDKLAVENTLFLFGSKSELPTLNKLASYNAAIIVVTGKLLFQQELELISNLDLMISMDSGNAHIAAMYGIKVVTLWGATHPYSGFAPFGQPFGNAITVDRNAYPLIPTSVYGNKNVDGYADAMRTISPDEVVGKVAELLQ